MVRYPLELRYLFAHDGLCETFFHKFTQTGSTLIEDLLEDLEIVHDVHNTTKFWCQI